MSGRRVADGWKGLDGLVLAEAGVTLEPSGLVRVPYRDATGAEFNAKLFAKNGRSWWETRGLGLIPFGVERLAPPGHRDRRELWVAEGESDTLALRAVYGGWRDRPVDVIGLPGAGTWQDSWEHHLADYHRVCSFPDGDEAGHRMAQRMSKTVPWIIRVLLPAGRDVRSTLQQEDGAGVLDRLIIEAEVNAALAAGMKLCSTLSDFERFLAEVRP